MSTNPPELQAALDDNATILHAIRTSRTFPRGPYPRIPEPARSSLHSKLRYLTEQNWLHDYRARTWGFTILRTAYRDGDDAKFRKGVEAIERFVRLWSGNEERAAGEEMARIRETYEAKRVWPEGMPERVNGEPNRVFLERFVNEVVEDREGLDGAGVAEICEYFKSWALAHWHGDPALISAGSPRLKSCIVLDAETLDQLQDVPEDIPVEQWYSVRGRWWVKMAEAYPQARWKSVADCYRVRLGDLVYFWFERQWREPFASTAPVEGEGEDVFYYRYD